MGRKRTLQNQKKFRSPNKELIVIIRYLLLKFYYMNKDHLFDDFYME